VKARDFIHHMKEAFDTMGEHWCVTLWLGIVVMVCFSRVQVHKHQNYHEHKDKSQH